jgi:hypothetical protein
LLAIFSGGNMKHFFAGLWASTLVTGAMAFDAKADLIPVLKINGVETTTVTPKKAMEWRIQFKDSKTGRYVTNFKSIMGRHMHLVIFKEDFSTISHFHPTLIGDTGIFSTVINQPGEDQESQGIATAIMTPGKYHVIAEVAENNGNWVPAPQYVRLSVTATGVAANKEIILDQLDGQCAYAKLLNKDGETGEFGATYRIKLHYETIFGDGGNLVRFHVGVEKWNTENQTYFPVRDLQEYIRMHGHLFITPADDQSTRERMFLHSHGMVHSGLHDGHMTFTVFDRGELNLRAPKGLRFWFQFRHQNQIWTTPFTFKYNAHFDHACGGH